MRFTTCSTSLHDSRYAGRAQRVLVSSRLLAAEAIGTGSRETGQVRTATLRLNRADRAELEQIPGIGPGLAKQIDEHRRAKGAFQSVDQLRDVKGIGPMTLDKVRPFFRVEPSTQSADLLPEPLILERKPTAKVPAPYPRSGNAGSKLQPGDPPIDVNAAGVAELTRLPGIGPVTAQNIVNARTEKPFASVADLDRVKGIGPKTLDKIRPFVVVK